ncbi:Signal transduction histidine kinase [Micromonospora echinaurantiaca]|uniref:histidine kinase n=1 Tax=Micromonospora echinaurantiaca TaxID=47857 RepID=A0A1C5JPX9_9ACTN|nr:histidine kinase [Micromonospora echinaurantiaca]SCG72543.1 Signal transduction histidine kinase [Micromonospora echinaurantiaca]
MTSTAAAPDHPWLLPGALTEAAGQPRRTTRDWIIDSLCFLIALVWVLLSAADAASPEPSYALNTGPSWLEEVDAVCGLAAAAGLWVRRRWPVGLAVATLPLSAFSVTASGALLIIIFTLTVHRPIPLAAGVTGVHLLTAFGYYQLRPDPTMRFWPAMIWTVLVLVAVLAWGMFVRARRQLVVSLRERAERAEAEQQLRVAQARQLERTRIAREMHDVLAHRISLLSLHAGALEFRPDAPPEEVARAAGVIRGSAHAALQDLREVIGVLRAETGAGQEPERPQPTLADLPALVEESRVAGVRVSVRDLVGAAERLPAAVGRSVYRIVQEGLTNARKHAAGAAVTVDVAGAPGDGLTVEIRNRWPVGGVADPEIPGAGTGLVGIAERVHLAGGRLEYGRDDTGDFRLAAWLPWPA